MDFISSTWALPSKLLPSRLLELQLDNEERTDNAEDALTVLPEEPAERKKFGRVPLIISVISTIFCVILFATWFLNKGYNNFMATIVVASIGVTLLLVNAVIGIHAVYQLVNHKNRSPVVKFSTSKPPPKLLAEKDQSCETQANSALIKQSNDAEKSTICDGSVA